jgi:hypothetical protein
VLRRFVIGVSALALGVSAVALTAGPASAKGAPVNATGTLHCAITGKVKVAPPLLFGGTSGSATFLAKIKSTSCSGTSGVSSVKGTYAATLPTNDCIALALTDFPHGVFNQTKLKGAAKYNALSASFSKATFTAADPIVMDVPGTGGTSTIGSGSFAGEHATMHFSYDQSAGTFSNNCTAKTKGIKGSGGLKKMSFTVSSTLDIS